MTNLLAYVVTAHLLAACPSDLELTTNVEPASTNWTETNNLTETKYDARQFAATNALIISLAEGGTMSRPIETVCVVTNVTTEIGNKCSGCAKYSIYIGDTVTTGHDWNCPEKRIPRNTKIVTTDVLEIRTLSFKWNDKDYALRQEKLLIQNIQRWELKADWVQTQ